MLLVEKLSKRLVRQQKNEVETSLSLPVALFQNYGAKRKMGVSYPWLAKQLTCLI